MIIYREFNYNYTNLKMLGKEKVWKWTFHPNPVPFSLKNSIKKRKIRVLYKISLIRWYIQSNKKENLSRKETMRSSNTNLGLGFQNPLLITVNNWLPLWNPIESNLVLLQNHHLMMIVIQITALHSPFILFCNQHSYICHFNWSWKFFYLMGLFVNLVVYIVIWSDLMSKSVDKVDT